MLFATSDPVKCPIDQLTLFADGSAPPGAPISRTSLSRVKLAMGTGTQGPNKYYMSIGSKANDFKSALYTGTILVCGLEKVETASPDP